MKTLSLTPFQAVALSAIKSEAERRGWKGELTVVEETLVYQVPLPRDPDLAGAFFAVDTTDGNILLYFLLPLAMPKSAIAAACEFVAGHSIGMRFGALEIDLNHGTLRVRLDCDVATGETGKAIERLIDRGRRVARNISPAWRQLCRDMQAVDAALQSS